MTCPHCGSAEVATTLHAVFVREGNDLRPIPAVISTETLCDDCGETVTDERAEALLIERYPELYQEPSNDD